MFKKISIVLFIGFLGWALQAMQPPPPKICGTAGGPPVTGLRIKLRDGRHLAYKEHGVPKGTAKFKVIFVHGLDCCRHYASVFTEEILEELRVHLVSFDVPGYGESDPHPKRTVESLALDIEELGDQLGLGSKFYLIGFSMGGLMLWGCLRYIPHRLAGATLIAPAINYWWPGLPANLSKEVYIQMPPQDQWALRIAHYTPWLTYWWNTQKWFDSLSVLVYVPDVFSHQDKELLKEWIPKVMPIVAQVRQQGDYESVHRDINIGFGKWEFDPMDLKNPFPNNEGFHVHLWQGDEDKLVPVTLQRYIVERLPWIHYHELPGAGHLLPVDSETSTSIIKSLLLGEKQNYN